MNSHTDMRFFGGKNNNKVVDAFGPEAGNNLREKLLSGFSDMTQKKTEAVNHWLGQIGKTTVTRAITHENEAVLRLITQEEVINPATLRGAGNPGEWCKNFRDAIEILRVEFDGDFVKKSDQKDYPTLGKSTIALLTQYRGFLDHLMIIGHENYDIVEGLPGSIEAHNLTDFFNFRKQIGKEEFVEVLKYVAKFDRVLFEHLQKNVETFIGGEAIGTPGYVLATELKDIVEECLDSPEHKKKTTINAWLDKIDRPTFSKSVDEKKVVFKIIQSKDVVAGDTCSDIRAAVEVLKADLEVDILPVNKKSKEYPKLRQSTIDLAGEYVEFLKHLEKIGAASYVIAEDSNPRGKAHDIQDLFSFRNKIGEEQFKSMMMFIINRDETLFVNLRENAAAFLKANPKSAPATDLVSILNECAISPEQARRKAIGDHRKKIDEAKTEKQRRELVLALINDPVVIPATHVDSRFGEIDRLMRDLIIHDEDKLVIGDIEEILKLHAALAIMKEDGIDVVKIRELFDVIKPKIANFEQAFLTIVGRDSDLAKQLDGNFRNNNDVIIKEALGSTVVPALKKLLSKGEEIRIAKEKLVAEFEKLSKTKTPNLAQLNIALKALVDLNVDSAVITQAISEGVRVLSAGSELSIAHFDLLEANFKAGDGHKNISRVVSTIEQNTQAQDNAARLFDDVKKICGTAAPTILDAASKAVAETQVKTVKRYGVSASAIYSGLSYRVELKIPVDFTDHTEALDPGKEGPVKDQWRALLTNLVTISKVLGAHVIEKVVIKDLVEKFGKNAKFTDPQLETVVKLLSDLTFLGSIPGYVGSDRPLLVEVIAIVKSAAQERRGQLVQKGTDDKVNDAIKAIGNWTGVKGLAGLREGNPSIMKHLQDMAAIMAKDRVGVIKQMNGHADLPKHNAAKSVVVDDKEPALNKAEAEYKAMAEELEKQGAALKILIGDLKKLAEAADSSKTPKSAFIQTIDALEAAADDFNNHLRDAKTKASPVAPENHATRSDRAKAANAAIEYAVKQFAEIQKQLGTLQKTNYIANSVADDSKITTLETRLQNKKEETLEHRKALASKEEDLVKLTKLKGLFAACESIVSTTATTSLSYSKEFYDYQTEITVLLTDLKLTLTNQVVGGDVKGRQKYFFDGAKEVGVKIDAANKNKQDVLDKNINTSLREERDIQTLIDAAKKRQAEVVDAISVMADPVAQLSAQMAKFSQTAQAFLVKAEDNSKANNGALNAQKTFSANDVFYLKHPTDGSESFHVLYASLVELIKYPSSPTIKQDLDAVFTMFNLSLDKDPLLLDSKEKNRIFKALVTSAAEAAIKFSEESSNNFPKIKFADSATEVTLRDYLKGDYFDVIVDQHMDACAWIKEAAGGKGIEKEVSHGDYASQKATPTPIKVKQPLVLGRAEISEKDPVLLYKEKIGDGWIETCLSTDASARTFAQEVNEREKFTVDFKGMFETAISTPESKVTIPSDKFLVGFSGPTVSMHPSKNPAGETITTFNVGFAYPKLASVGGTIGDVRADVHKEYWNIAYLPIDLGDGKKYFIEVTMHTEDNNNLLPILCKKGDITVRLLEERNIKGTNRLAPIAAMVGSGAWSSIENNDISSQIKALERVNLNIVTKEYDKPKIPRDTFESATNPDKVLRTEGSKIIKGRIGKEVDPNKVGYNIEMRDIPVLDFNGKHKHFAPKKRFEKYISFDEKSGPLALQFVGGIVNYSLLTIPGKIMPKFASDAYVSMWQKRVFDNRGMTQQTFENQVSEFYQVAMSGAIVFPDSKGFFGTKKGSHSEEKAIDIDLSKSDINDLSALGPLLERLDAMGIAVRSINLEGCKNLWGPNRAANEEFLTRHGINVRGNHDNSFDSLKLRIVEVRRALNDGKIDEKTARRRLDFSGAEYRPPVNTITYQQIAELSKLAIENDVKHLVGFVTKKTTFSKSKGEFTDLSNVCRILFSLNPSNFDEFVTKASGDLGVGKLGRAIMESMHVNVAGHENREAVFNAEVKGNFDSMIKECVDALKITSSPEQKRLIVDNFRNQVVGLVNDKKAPSTAKIEDTYQNVGRTQLNGGDYQTDMKLQQPGKKPDLLIVEGKSVITKEFLENIELDGIARISFGKGCSVSPEVTHADFKNKDRFIGLDGIKGLPPSPNIHVQRVDQVVATEVRGLPGH